MLRKQMMQASGMRDGMIPTITSGQMLPQSAEGRFNTPKMRITAPTSLEKDVEAMARMSLGNLRITMRVKRETGPGE